MSRKNRQQGQKYVSNHELNLRQRDEGYLNRFLQLNNKAQETLDSVATKGRIRKVIVQSRIENSSKLSIYKKFLLE